MPLDRAGILDPVRLVEDDPPPAKLQQRMILPGLYRRGSIEDAIEAKSFWAEVIHEVRR